jgi:hypothetical protein
MCVEMAEETFAEKVKRLQQEIAVRQAELANLVLGDPRQSVHSDGERLIPVRRGIIDWSDNHAENMRRIESGE